MFDELMNIIRGEGQDAVVNNPAVPNEQNEAVMQEAGSSIMDSMQGMLQQGGPGALKELFAGVQSGDPNHPAVQQVANNFSGGLMEKFGLNSGAAKALAMSLIPIVLSKIMSRASANNGQGTGGFNLGSILGGLMGGGNNAGSSGGLGGMLGGLFGGGQQQQQPQQEDQQSQQAQPQTANTSGGGNPLDNIGGMLGLDKNGDGHTDLKDLMSMFGR